MHLLIGLGNPGPRYARNRHNVGFRAADAIHSAHPFTAWKQQFSAEVAQATIDGERCLLMKPLTFVNRSGEAAGAAARFYGIATAQVVAIYDELDLPPGKVRVRRGGGTAGHNGIRSLAAHLGPDFRRVRVGIGHPGDKSLVHDYVLHDFARADEAWLVPLMRGIAENAPLLLRGQDSTFANRLHEAMAGQPKDGEASGTEAPRGAHRDRNPGSSGLAGTVRRLFGR
jgi:PTH1 family peptidyl-tRNA hydrolase